MNELITLVTFVFFASCILIFMRLGRVFLYAFSAFLIIGSAMTVGVTTNLFGITVSLGIISYSLIYLITDILSEYYEKNSAYKLAVSNLIIQILFFMYLYMTLLVEPTAGSQQYFQGLEDLFGIVPRITFAAIIASAGAFFDIWVYERLRDYFRARWKFPGALALRNNISTILGQSLNSILFFGIALYGVVDNLGEVIASAIVIKIVIALMDTPFIYLAKWMHPKDKVDQAA